MAHLTTGPGEPDPSIAPWCLRVWMDGALGHDAAARIAALAPPESGRSLASALIEVVDAGLPVVERRIEAEKPLDADPAPSTCPECDTALPEDNR